MNRERASGTVSSVEVREGHVVGVTSEQDLNEMRDWALAFVREKHSSPENIWWKGLTC